MSSHTDAVWNRALDLDAPSAATHPGDAALLTVLTFHGLVMNGGLFNAVELHVHDDVYPVDAVVDAYQYFGLEEAAAAIDNAVMEQHGFVNRTEDDALDDADELDATEVRIDESYTLSDEDIEAALDVAIANDPEAFAPVD